MPRHRRFSNRSVTGRPVRSAEPKVHVKTSWLLPGPEAPSFPGKRPPRLPGAGSFCKPSEPRTSQRADSFGGRLFLFKFPQGVGPKIGDEAARMGTNEAREGDRSLGLEFVSPVANSSIVKLNPRARLIALRLFATRTVPLHVGRAGVSIRVHLPSYFSLVPRSSVPLPSFKLFVPSFQSDVET